MGRHMTEADRLTSRQTLRKEGKENPVNDKNNKGAFRQTYGEM